MVNEDDLDLRRGVAAPSRVPGSPFTTSSTDTTQECDKNDRDLPWCTCASGQPDLALDESEIGPARVQVLWCSRCDTVLTTITEVQDDGDD